MQFLKKFFALSVCLFLVGSVLFVPQPVQASSCVYADGSNGIQEVGKKFVILKFEGNLNKTVCISVGKDAQSINFEDIQRTGVIKADWSGRDVTVEKTECIERDPGVRNPSVPAPGPWRELARSGHQLDAIRIEVSNRPSCAEDVNLDPFAEIWANHAGDDDVFAGKTRYKITAGAFNQPFYVSFEGTEQASDDVYSAQQNCVIGIKQKRPECVPDGQENSTPSALLKSYEGNAQIPADCKKDMEACILNSLPAGTTDPDADKAAIKNMHANDPHYQRPSGYEGPLPDCAFSYEGCRDINELLRLFINLGKALFGVIGTFAFMMFIYGGFTMILSMGSSEKVKKGQEILVAAVVGIMIAFGAYLIIDFVLDALQVSDDFRAVGNLEQLDKLK